MNKIDRLIKGISPKDVQVKKLWEVTIWDKKFSNVDSCKQPNKLKKYKKVSAKKLKSLESKKGTIRLYTTGNYIGYTTNELGLEYINNDEVITIPDGRANIKYIKGQFIITDHNKLMKSNNKNILTKYIYYFLMDNLYLIQSFYSGAAPQSCDMSKLFELEIPIPPIEVQLEIVKILDKFTKLEAELEAELEARIKQYEYYKNKLLLFENNNVKYVKFGDVARFVRGASPRPIKEFITNDKDSVNWIKIGDASPGTKYITETKEKITRLGAKKSRYVKPGDLILSNSMSFGRPYILGIEGCIHDGWLAITNFDRNLNSDFLYHLLSSKAIQQQIFSGVNIGAVKNLNANIVKSIVLPLPSKNEQKRIANILDNFEKLVNNVREGIPAEIKLRRKQYEYYRHKLLSFNKGD